MDAKTEIIFNEKEIDETLSTQELIRLLNGERAIQRAIRSAPSIRWTDNLGLGIETVEQA